MALTGQFLPVATVRYSGRQLGGMKFGCASEKDRQEDRQQVLLRPYRTVAGYLIQFAASVCFVQYWAAVFDM